MHEKKTTPPNAKPDFPEGDIRNLPLFRDDWLDDLDETLDELDRAIEEGNRLLGLPPLETL
jgi:hypothetical protein